MPPGWLQSLGGIVTFSRNISQEICFSNPRPHQTPDTALKPQPIVAILQISGIQLIAAHILDVSESQCRRIVAANSAGLKNN